MSHSEKPSGLENLNIELPNELLDIIDLNRLKQLTQLTDQARQNLINKIERDRGTEAFLMEASILKTLEPNRFEQDVQIDEDDWSEMIESVENTRSHAEFFISACAQAYRIGGNKMKQEIEITEDYWQQILKAIEKNKKYPLDYIRLVSLANEIRPEGKPKVAIPRAEWEQMKDDLKNKLSKISDSKFELLSTELGHLQISA